MFCVKLRGQCSQYSQGCATGAPRRSPRTNLSFPGLQIIITFYVLIWTSLVYFTCLLHAMCQNQLYTIKQIIIMFRNLFRRLSWCFFIWGERPHSSKAWCGKRYRHQYDHRSQKLKISILIKPMISGINSAVCLFLDLYPKRGFKTLNAEVVVHLFGANTYSDCLKYTYVLFFSREDCL